MGDLIKINVYEGKKKIDGRIIRIMNIKSLEKNISSYNNWLRKNNREDRLENYDEFLQVR